MQKRGFLRITIFLFLTLSETSAIAANEFQLVVENDTWLGTDRYYTNGLKFGVGHSLETLHKPMEDLLYRFTPEQFLSAENSAEFGLFIGQNMYTPKNIRISDPQPFDRPWAAWLYLGGVRQLSREDRRLDTIEIDLGVVGPAAGGRWIQTEWHELIKAPKPLGWDNQLPNEPAFLISYLQKRRFGSDTLNIVSHAGLTAGTVMTLARAGAMLRLGQNMSGFGADTIEPGGVIMQNTRKKEHYGEWFVFLAMDHRLVAHNIFLDGTVFHKSVSVDKRQHVYDLNAGLSARFGIVRLSITRVRRSEEFSTVSGGGGAQFFHSINLGFELK